MGTGRATAEDTGAGATGAVGASSSFLSSAEAVQAAQAASASASSASSADRSSEVAVLAALRARPLRFPFTRDSLRCWAYLAAGAVLGLVTAVLLLALTALGLGLSVVGVGLPLLLAVALSGLPVGALERRRLRLVEPAPVPDPHRALPGAGRPARLRTRLRERATWRELAHTLLVAPPLTAAGLGLTALLLFSATLVVSPVVVQVLAPETVMLLPGHAVPGPLHALPFTAVGLAGLYLGGHAGALLTTAHVRLARLLLGPREEDPGGQVLELTRSRARLADAFEAERRRIERDLHDGAQQQLVALTMTLGLAAHELRERAAAGVRADAHADAGDADADETAEAGDVPPGALALVDRARGEARQALEQLRGLVRGIHPQVLTDHGLAAAVAEVALRHPVPVEVDLDLPGRLPGPVETTAYFTVTEALTNAAKHSGATAVTVHGRVAAGRLVLRVTDDGCGGADPAAGAGLQGLADRVAILRGRLMVTSPTGGPTTLRLEVPCSG
ncbi:sensor histidine kinase [Kitasatospora purpeofusca]|uniref:sensor histidine kinase n=1 Tax=Kitasatospora purpeofusca TaxID=67352 RepID=UPI002A5A8C53|nr:sensor domain-containing protein [Kitasatospora purpeofusca]MDY0812408.1 sensor domain-containing protein [Kitasatospora purpeofusca]